MGVVVDNKSSEEIFIEVMRSSGDRTGFEGGGSIRGSSTTGGLSNCSSKCEKSRLFSRRS